MASLCFLVGQPSSGSCCTLTPGRELAAASLISRDKQFPFPMQSGAGCWSAGQGSPVGSPNSRTKPGLPSALWVAQEATEGEAELWLKVKIRDFQAEKKERCVAFPAVLYSVVCLLPTKCVSVTDFY